jgi:serpin B
MKNIRLIPLLLFLLTFDFVSCKKSVVVPNKGKDLVLTPIEQQKVTADNAFTLKLFKNLNGGTQTGANLFVSPLSVSFAMAMTGNGSYGQTQWAIDSAMSFKGFTRDQINSYYHKLITELPELDPNTTINIANSIWYRQDFSVLPQFLLTGSVSYNAKIQALDFNNPASVGIINSWVSGQTHGNIPAIVGQVPSTALMYLVNAMYFKSSWKEKFNAVNTARQDFYLDNNTTVSANFMSNDKLDFKRYTTNEAGIYELPYSNSKYSMVIVMPASGTTLQQLVSGLDSTKWRTWMKGLSNFTGPLKMPKFKFSFSTALNNSLTALGMGNAFSTAADFSRISTVKPLFISDVLHKAFVDVDESGTTAAAATVVVIGTTASLPPPPVVINHPFLFAIREMSSGLILFIGTVNNPLLTGN